MNVHLDAWFEIIRKRNPQRSETKKKLESKDVGMCADTAATLKWPGSGKVALSNLRALVLMPMR